MNKGFTLIEILVVIGIILLIFGAGSFINFSSYNHTLINTEETTLVSILSKARSQAMNNIDASSHGVYIEADDYVLYDGTNFTTGTNKEVMPKNSKTAITTNYGGDIYFTQLSGEPSGTLPAVINLNDGTNTRTITIKTGGVIDW